MLSQGHDFNKPLARNSDKTVAATFEYGKWDFNFGKGINQSDIERIRKDIMSYWMKHKASR